jgi:hypothetical protein
VVSPAGGGEPGAAAGAEVWAGRAESRTLAVSSARASAPVFRRVEGIIDGIIRNQGLRGIGHAVSETS